MADPTIDAQMTTVVQSLQSAFAAGVAQAQASGTSGVLNWIANELVGNTDEEAAIAANLNQTQAFIQQLDGDLRNAVDTGTNQAGNPYDISQWMAFAKTVGDDIKSQTGYAWDSSGLNVLYETAKGTYEQVKNPFAWPWYVWALGAVAGLAILGPYVNLGAAALKKLPDHNPSPSPEK